MTRYTFDQLLANPDLVVIFDPAVDQVVFEGITAINVHVTSTATDTTLTTYKGRITLPFELARLESGVNIVFADGTTLQAGGAAANPLTGTDLADQFHGLSGNDTITAGGGNDLIYGNRDDDVISSGQGDDTVFGGQGADHITDDGGANVIYGQYGDDTVLSLGSGNDTIYGGQGDDVIDAGAGDDWLYGQRGDDTMTGGAGNDMFVLRLRENGYDEITDFTAGADKIVLPYNVFGIRDAGDIIFDGMPGFLPYAYERGGNFIFTEESHTLWYDRDGYYSYPPRLIAVFSDDVFLSLHDFRIVGVPRSFLGTNGADTFIGESGNDTIRAFGGDDYLEGGHGDDIFHGGNGDDTMIGGEGIDTLHYTNFTVQIRANLQVGTVHDGYGDTDHVEGIEILYGTNYNDTIIGNSDLYYTSFNSVVPYSGELALYGLSGNDLLRGFNGYLLSGGDGNDTIESETGVNRLEGGRGHDSMTGGTGHETMTGGTGHDFMWGAGGNDDMHGNAGNDTMAGGTGDDTMRGGGGDDVLMGGAGDDFMRGGKGVDIMAGGSGADTIKGGRGSDVITGGKGDDVIDASGVRVIGPVGMEFQANSYTYGYQREPDVTALSDGGYVVTWESRYQDGSGYGVYGQRYDASGLPVGNEFRINTYSYYDQEAPAVTETADGGFVVVWQSEGRDGWGYSIQGQRFDAAGNTLGDEFQVNTATDGSQTDPHVVTLADGSFVVAWESYVSHYRPAPYYYYEYEYDMTAQRFDANGNPRGGEFKIVGADAREPAQVALTALENGGFVAVWDDYQSYQTYVVRGQVFDAAGNKLGAQINIAVPGSNTQDSAAVTALKGGGFVVTWESIGTGSDGFDVYAQTFNAAGQAQAAAVRINSHLSNYQGQADVAALEDGGYVVTWTSGQQYYSYASGYTQDGYGTGVFGQRFDAAGNRVGDEFQVNTYTDHNQQNVSVTGLNDGGWVVTWDSAGQDNEDSGYYSYWYYRYGSGVYGQRYDADGNPVGVESAPGDTITGGAGNDTMTGDMRADTFIYKNILSDGHDLIHEFNPVSDRIDMDVLFDSMDVATEQRAGLLLATDQVVTVNDQTFEQAVLTIDHADGADFSIAVRNVAAADLLGAILVGEAPAPEPALVDVLTPDAVSPDGVI